MDGGVLRCLFSLAREVSKGLDLFVLFVLTREDGGTKCYLMERSTMSPFSNHLFGTETRMLCFICSDLVFLTGEKGGRENSR